MKQPIARSRLRLTLAEALIGIAVLSIPLAYWNIKIQNFRPMPLKHLPPLKTPNDIQYAKNAQLRKNKNAMKAREMTCWTYAIGLSVVYLAFLVRRRIRRADQG